MIASMTMADLQKTVKHMADIEKHVKLVLNAVDVVFNGIYSVNGSNITRYTGSDRRGWTAYDHLVDDTARLSTATNEYLAALKSAN